MKTILNQSEAVYGFVAWLTTREEKIVMSAYDDASPVVELVKQFCEANHLPEVSEHWPNNLIHPSGEVAVPGVGHNAIPRSDKTKEAFEVIKQAMVDDDPSKPGSYAHSWHCNIAMMCIDAIRIDVVSESLTWEEVHRIGNDAASRFMKLCFDVDTKV